jgi:hypothetical protein
VILRELITKLGFQFDEASFKKAEQGIKKLQDAGEKLSNFGEKMSLYVTAPITAFAAGAVIAADQTNDALEFLQDNFKGVGDEATKAAERIAASYGLSTASAANFLGKTGQILQSLGLNEEQALKYSESIQGMSADLAAFNNLEGGAAEATQIMTAAIAGQTKGLKQLGIIIDEESIKARILDMQRRGQVFTTDAQAKSMAVLSLVQEKSAKAQGAYERKSKGFGNTQARITERIKELGAQFGKFLLPTVEKMALAFERFINRMINLDDRTKGIIVGILKFAAVIGPVAVAIGGLITGLAGLAAFLPAIQAGLALISVPAIILAAKLLAIVAVITLVVLALEDLYTWFQGGESYFGDFLKWIQKIAQQFTDWIWSFELVNKFADKLIERIQLISKLWTYTKSLFGDTQLPTATASQVAGGAPSNTNNVSQSANLKIDVNATGMNPDEAAGAVSKGVQSGLSNVFRQTTQNFVPAGDY